MEDFDNVVYNYTPENITQLGKNDVFVFGSNLEGMYLGGAARVAVEKFGALNTFYVTRIGCGITGFTDEEIAPLFDKALDLYNVRLPKSFVEIILRNRRKALRSNE